MIKLLISALMAMSLLVSGGAMAKGKPSDVGVASSSSGKNVDKVAKGKPSDVGVASSNSGTNVDKVAKKLTARELKSLNAAKANIAAFVNSNSNSKIGKIALYKDAALETVAANNQYDVASFNLESSLNVWRETKEQLDSLVTNYTGRLADDIKADLDALDPDSETYQADLASLEEEKTTYNAFVLTYNSLADIVNEDVASIDSDKVSLSNAQKQYEEALAMEQTILSEELNSPNLSVEALAELRSLLDL
tara:strand:- start:391 stop:1140 length:750 start_codon:yes stop_codon:yes gene_type:complete